MTAQPFNGLEMKQADRNRKHTPGGGEIAARVRGGATIPELAAEYGVGKTGIYDRLRESGYTSEGHNAAYVVKPTPTPEYVYAPEPEEWRDHAACANQVTCPDDDYWHPDGRGYGVEAAEQKAKSICLGCDVREVCLDYALRIDALSDARPWGVFGGLNGEERHQLRKRMGGAA
jgi:WhiB family redox-sensing transcriptional regulator